MTPLVAVDVGGSTVRTLVETGSAQYTDEFAWPTIPRGGVEELHTLVRRLIAIVGDSATASVAVAFPGSVNCDGTVARWPGRPGWDGVALIPALRNALGRNVVVHDDADLAATAEAVTGPPTFLYLGLGTGIGGALVRDGELFRFAAQRPEFGHMCVDPRARSLCGCGRMGCLQSIASGPATLARATRRAGREVTRCAFIDALASGRRWAWAPLLESVRALALAVCDVAELFAPPAVVIGGGFGDAVPELSRLLAAEIARRTRAGTAVPDVRRAVHGPQSSLVGALLTARVFSTNSNGRERSR